MSDSRGGTLSSRILTDANLIDNILEQVDLSNNELRFSYIKDMFVTLSTCNSLGMHNCDVYDSTFSFMKLDRAYINATTFENCTFEGCFFTSATIKGCAFRNCRFLDCTFAESVLIYCETDTSEFIRCNFDNSEIVGFTITNQESCFKNGRPISRIITIHGLYYPIEIFDGHFKFGCSIRPISDYENMTTRDLLEVDGRTAVNFHKNYLQWMLHVARTEGMYA